MHWPGLRIEREGATLHTQESGSPDAPCVLFLHDALGSLADFAPIAAQFPEFRCVFADARGHGASSLGSASLRRALIVDDIEAVIAAYGLERPVLIGHGDGAVTALHVALRRPLAGLVTLCGQAEPPRPETARAFPDTVDAWRAAAPAAATLYEHINPSPDVARLFEQVRVLRGEVGGYPGGALAALQCPALVLGSDADPLVPRAETLLLASLLPTAALGLYPFASHAVLQDATEAVSGAIRTFLRRSA